MGKKIAIALVCVLVGGCALNDKSMRGSSFENLLPAPTPMDVVVINSAETLNDGGWLSWKLDPGKYELEMTASNDGVTVEWIGGTCGKSEPLRRATMVCVMNGTGQIIFENPTVFGFGKSASVTVKVTKLAH